MASINKRGPYQWQVKIRKNGWPKQSKTFETYDEAARWARKIETEMDDGIFVSRKEAETTTLNEALDRYGREKTRTRKAQHKSSTGSSTSKTLPWPAAISRPSAVLTSLSTVINAWPKAKALTLSIMN